MTKGKPGSRYNFEMERCEFSKKDTWCHLPKNKRCEHCLCILDGSKVCEIEL